MSRVTLGTLRVAVASPGGMEKRRATPWVAGCLVPLAGAAAGYGAYRLSRAARGACSVLLREHPSLFDLWTWEAPLTIAAAVVVGVAAWGASAAAVRRYPRCAVHLIAPAGLFFVALAGFTLVHFMLVGTPVGIGSDSDTCTADHVPPWWPSWLPD